MANKQTELSLQYLKNISADMSVDPAIPREGMLGKAADGNWYNLKVNSNGELKTEDLQYMGSKTVTTYDYLGFKQKGGTAWFIMRFDSTDDGAVAYAYSSTGGHSWTTAWTTPAGESYGDPPDS